MPLADLGVLDYLKYEFHPPVPKSGLYTYFPGTAEVPERSAANIHGVSYKVLAQVEIPDGSALGVIIAQGSRFGGHVLFVKDRKFHYFYNFSDVALSPLINVRMPQIRYSFPLSRKLDMYASCYSSVRYQSTNLYSPTR